MNKRTQHVERNESRKNGTARGNPSWVRHQLNYGTRNNEQNRAMQSIMGPTSVTETGRKLSAEKPKGRERERDGLPCPPAETDDEDNYKRTTQQQTTQ